MRPAPFPIAFTLLVAACSGGSAEREQARLVEWRKLTIDAGLSCDRPLLATDAAMRRGDPVTASALASQAAVACKDAASRISQFGALPGKGTVRDTSVNHPCAIDSAITSQAAEQTIALIDGDQRPSVQAKIQTLFKERDSNMAACKRDMSARAKSLGVTEESLEAIVRQARLRATGSAEPQTTGQASNQSEKSD